MKKKKYSNSRQVENLLREHVQFRKCNGDTYLASERELTIMFGTSRVTLHKAIVKLKNENLLCCDGRKMRIVRPYSCLGGCGRIIFIAAAQKNVFAMSAMERLWNTLESMLLRNGAELELVLVGEDTCYDDVFPVLSSAKVVLVTGCYGSAGERVIELLNEMRYKIPVISLLDSMLFPNRICLDNYAAGAIAAEALLQAGCKRPFAVWAINTTHDFSCRAQGFADKLFAHRAGGINSVFWCSSVAGSFSLAYRQRIEWALDHGYDGVFVMSDENIGDSVDCFISAGKIPSELKIVTMDGTYAAYRHNPPISCVSHATAKIAAMVFEQMRLVAEGKFDNVHHLFHPEFRNHGTV